MKKTYLENYSIGARIFLFNFCELLLKFFQFSRHARKNFRDEQNYSCASYERENSPLQKKTLATCANNYLLSPLKRQNATPLVPVNISEERIIGATCTAKFSILNKRILKWEQSPPLERINSPDKYKELRQPTRLAEHIR